VGNKHSPLGPSSANRWFECAGSIELIKQASKEPSNVHAERGTAAHGVVEACLGTEKSVWDFEDEEYPGGELNEEDIQAVEDTIDWVEEQIGPEDMLFKEVKIDLNILFPDLYGTLDIVIGNTDTLKVYDYKHGSGQAVEVEDNEQLLYYALGAIAKYAPHQQRLLGWGNAYKTVEIGILQPRKDHVDGPFRTWVVPPEALDAFAIKLRTKALATTKPNASLNPGSHCRWCPAKAICGAMYSQTLEVTKADFRKKELPTINQLEIEDISKILQHEELITSWLKSLKSYALQTLERGGKVPGFKLVKKRANRVWTDEKAAQNCLLDTGLDNDETHDFKFKSPAKIEKILKDYSFYNQEELQKLIAKPDNGNTIAPESDRRQEVPASIETDFEVIKEA